jgi:transcriptional regulator with AbiEi antitoxin domain of type IV toxin-antitoxin system
LLAPEFVSAKPPYGSEDPRVGREAKIDLAQIDFGKGKRMLVKGGRFDPKYKITVPNTEAGPTVSGA